MVEHRGDHRGRKPLIFEIKDIVRRKVERRLGALDVVQDGVLGGA